MSPGAIDEADMPPTLGWRAQEVAEELPALQLAVTQARIARSSSWRGGSPRAIKDRLRTLANRFNGARAVNLRREPLPAAYRVFFRQIGLDPDISPTPIEGAVMLRMMKGGIASQGLIDDVLLITLLDTCVPVWALDPETLDGPLGIRVSREGEPLGRRSGAPMLPAGRLVIADGSTAVALLFDELAPAHRAGPDSERAVLFTLQVAGVPWLHLEEALCMAARMLAMGGEEQPAG